MKRKTKTENQNPPKTETNLRRRIPLLADEPRTLPTFSKIRRKTHTPRRIKL